MPNPEDIVAELEQDLSPAALIDLIHAARSSEEVDAIERFATELLDARLAEAIGGFKARTRRFLNVTERILSELDKLDSQFVRISPNRSSGAAPSLSSLVSRLSEALRLFHDGEGMRKTQTSLAEAGDIDNDETEVPPSTSPVPVEPIVSPQTPLVEQVTSTSRRFEELADEYSRFFLGAGYKNDRLPLIRKLGDRALANRSRYESVSDPLGIPWWFIAGVHMLESTFNFDTHFHNGDSLDGRTFRVPAGRPEGGNPPFTWEESAEDALLLHRLGGLSDWSIPRALWRWERYNGFGYREQRIPTPYLWSFSTIYSKGKFVGDGVFASNAVSKQCGCATLIKYLHEEGEIDLNLDIVGEDESDIADSHGSVAAADSDDAAAGDADGGTDGNVPSHPFEIFFRSELPGVRHFKWHEFLTKGASNRTLGTNTDPPVELWPSVIPLVRVLDEFRERVGVPVTLNSVYRNAVYNKAVGGKTRSHHMAFIAADFKVGGSGAGSAGDWAKLARALRGEGVFEGGIGVYNTFVHVDVRGTRADWDERT